MDDTDPSGQARHPITTSAAAARWWSMRTTGEIRYSIRKRLSDARKQCQRQFFVDAGNRSLAATYFGGAGSDYREPFAVLHRH